MLTTLALDAMGGDHGPRVVVPAALRVLKTHPDVKLILVGKEELLQPMLKHRAKGLEGRWEIQHASEVVAMDESPAQALRSKKDSSLRVMINLVKEGRAQACVSAGNTGALMATARFVLKMLPGIDRPAIIYPFPTHDGKEVRILDLGANVDSSPESLYQFAVMGSILAQAMDSNSQPRVGLLNIGEEDIKGNELVKKAAELFSESKAINYIGFVEGDKIFRDVADVIVCDGFVGNITLKAVEGLAKLIGQMTREVFQETWWTKLLSLPALPVLKRLVKRIDPDRHNGATLVGLDGIVIKSHGGATVKAYTHAIHEAIHEVEKNIPELIRQQVGQALQTNQAEETS